MVSMEALRIHSEEAEQAVIGSVLIDEKCFELIKDWIPSDDVFYGEKHQKIWNSIYQLKRENIPVDLVNVSAKNSGLAYYITGLVEKVPTTANVESYARQINQDWLRRKLVIQSETISKRALDSTNNINSLLEDVHETATSLLNLEPGQKFDLDSLLVDTKSSLFEKKNLTTTGIKPLDDIISGMTKGEITIFAGRPGNAKTNPVI